MISEHIGEYKFPNMLGPYDDWEVGFERALRVSNALRLEVVYAKMNGVEGLVRFVSEKLMGERPWQYFPDAEKPTPIDNYFRIVTGLDLPAVLAMMRAYGRDDVANRLEGDRARHDAGAVAAGGDKNPEGVGGWSNKKRDLVIHNSVMNDKIDKAVQGNSAAYTLRRLARERPDLLARVEAGEMTANKAAIESGFRKKLTPLEAARKAIAKLNEEDRATLVAELIKENTQ